MKTLSAHTIATATRLGVDLDAADLYATWQDRGVSDAATGVLRAAAQLDDGISQSSERLAEAWADLNDTLTPYADRNHWDLRSAWLPWL